MNSLAEKLSVKQAPVYQGEPVIAEQAGSVLWAVANGARVAAWDKLGEVSSIYSARIVACNASGALAYLVQDGQQVKAGDVLAYIKPLQAPAKPTARATSNHTHTHDKTPQRQPGAASEPSAQDVAALNVGDTMTLTTWENDTMTLSQPAQQEDQQPARRSTMSPAMELTLLDAEEEAPPPVKRPKRPKIVRKTCRPTDHQEQSLIKLMDELAKEGYDFSEGELHRVAFEWLLNLSRRELVTRAEENRDREIAGRYGFGARPSF